MKRALVFDEEAGRIVVPSQTLSAIVSVAVERAGARVRRHPRRAIEFELGDGGGDGDAAVNRVEVGIVASGAEVLPELTARVQTSVHEALGLMCELDELAVDVIVEEVG